MRVRVLRATANLVQTFFPSLKSVAHHPAVPWQDVQVVLSGPEAHPIVLAVQTAPIREKALAHPVQTGASAVPEYETQLVTAFPVARATQAPATKTKLLAQVAQPLTIYEAQLVTAVAGASHLNGVLPAAGVPAFGWKAPRHTIHPELVASVGAQKAAQLASPPSLHSNEVAGVAKAVLTDFQQAAQDLLVPSKAQERHFPVPQPLTAAGVWVKAMLEIARITQILANIFYIFIKLKICSYLY
jgi:hypothetical protein